jgi:hypothetical protein
LYIVNFLTSKYKFIKKTIATSFFGKWPSCSYLIHNPTLRVIPKLKFWEIWLQNIIKDPKSIWWDIDRMNHLPNYMGLVFTRAPLFTMEEFT